LIQLFGLVVKISPFLFIFHHLAYYTQITVL